MMDRESDESSISADEFDRQKPSLSSSSVSAAAAASLSSSTSNSKSDASSESSEPSAELDEAEKNRAARYAKVRHGFRRKPTALQGREAGNARQERTYSDSDNSVEYGYVNRNTRNRRTLFDIEAYSENVWGKRSLLDNLDAEVIDSLIGWAHSSASPLDQDPESDGSGQLHEAWRNNPLAYLANSPLPLSTLNYFAHRANHIPECYESLIASFDTSALVAVGVLIEEMITASLLPLAGCHVLRCQQVEGRPSEEEALLNPMSVIEQIHPISGQKIAFDPRNIPKEESPFISWTLPPEEAVLRVAQQGMLPDTGIPLLRDPARSGKIRKSQVSGHKKIVEQIFEETFENKKILGCNKELRDIFFVRKKYVVKRNRKRKASSPDNDRNEPIGECYSSRHHILNTSSESIDKK